MDQQYNPYTNPQDSGNQNNQNSYTPPQFQFQSAKSANIFETASLALSIGAIIFCTSFYLAYILGALAIVFALLSRGEQMKMGSKARLGFILGIAAIILTTVVTVGAFYTALVEFGSIEGLIREYCNMYGLDFEELYGDLF